MSEVVPFRSCPYCSEAHPWEQCPRLSAIVYYEGGQRMRVEFVGDPEIEFEFEDDA